MLLKDRSFWLVINVSKKIWGTSEVKMNFILVVPFPFLWWKWWLIKGLRNTKNDKHNIQIWNLFRNYERKTNWCRDITSYPSGMRGGNTSIGNEFSLTFYKFSCIYIFVFCGNINMFHRFLISNTFSKSAIECEILP